MTVVRLCSRNDVSNGVLLSLNGQLVRSHQCVIAFEPFNRVRRGMIRQGGRNRTIICCPNTLHTTLVMAGGRLWFAPCSWNGDMWTLDKQRVRLYWCVCLNLKLLLVFDAVRARS